MHRILIAEDEPRIASFLEKGLFSHGFTTAVVADGNEVVLMVQEGEFDLLILDLGLPGKDGIEVIEDLRGQGESLPIIILTARDDIKDKITGLESGADDYVTKPFRFEELLARVRVRLRSSTVSSVNNDTLLRVGNIILDLRTRRIKVDGRTVDLPAREFTLELIRKVN
ncbi:DNA-binding response regulator, partial [Fischerella thermalis WC559]